MTFTFNTGIPASNDNPSVDQPDMLSNTVATNAILAVDHITFNTANGGTHKQVTYSSLNTPGVQVDPGSTAYTAAGVVDPTHPQNYWKNSQGTFPLSAIRAFGNFTTVTSGSPTLTASFNVASVTGNSGNYVITLTANSTSGNNVVFLATMSPSSGAINYSFTTGVFTLVTASQAGFKLNFLVLQI